MISFKIKVISSLKNANGLIHFFVSWLIDLSDFHFRLVTWACPKWNARLWYLVVLEELYLGWPQNCWTGAVALFQRRCIWCFNLFETLIYFDASFIFCHSITYFCFSYLSIQVDVFSFGIVMWELFTGEEPYADLHYGAIIGNNPYFDLLFAKH